MVKIESEVYVREPGVGYKTNLGGWENEPNWLDAIVYSRDVGNGIREVVSEGGEVVSEDGLHPYEIDHYFRSKGMLADDLEKSVIKMGFTPLYKRQSEWNKDGNSDVFKMNTIGWLLHWEIRGEDIIDPDGWDRNDLDKSFDELITLDTFEERIRKSTMRSTPMVQKFLRRKEPWDKKERKSLFSGLPPDDGPGGMYPWNGSLKRRGL